MVMITKILPDGTERHCTARCYNSSKLKCTCICKGLLHAKGMSYAKLMAQEATMYLQLQNRDGSKFFVSSELIQDMRGL